MRPISRRREARLVLPPEVTYESVEKSDQVDDRTLHRDTFGLGDQVARSGNLELGAVLIQ